MAVGYAFFQDACPGRGILGEKKVKRNGHALKRASAIQVGDVLEIPFVEGPGVREIFVTDVIDRRVAAPVAQACYEDKTKPEVYEALKEWQVKRLEALRAGEKGRPTKKDRRAIDQIKPAWEWDEQNGFDDF